MVNTDDLHHSEPWGVFLGEQQGRLFPGAEPVSFVWYFLVPSLPAEVPWNKRSWLRAVVLEPQCASQSPGCSSKNFPNRNLPGEPRACSLGNSGAHPGLRNTGLGEAKPGKCRGGRQLLRCSRSCLTRNAFLTHPHQHRSLPLHWLCILFL